MIAFPLVALILIFGLLKILIASLLPTVSFILGIIINALAEALIWIVQYIASLDISQILIGSVPLIFILLYCVFILFVRWAIDWSTRGKVKICIVGVIIIITSLGLIKYHRTNRQDFSLTILSVGHGQAVVIAASPNQNFIFDAGSLSIKDTGSKIVNPFLRCAGVNKIDALFISHNNSDHLNGIPEIIEQNAVKKLYAPQIALTQPKLNGGIGVIKKFMSNKGMDLQPIPSEIESGPKIKMKILWPDEKICLENNFDENNSSQVTLIEFAGRKILLCSDIEQSAQQKLMELYPDLSADIAIVPHHGSTSTLADDFLGQLGAQVSIISCGQRDYQRQTAKSPRRQGTFYTAESGAVTITIDRDGTIETKTHLP